MAIAGQPFHEVAIQAGQFIKYGCRKGECGTCEARPHRHSSPHPPPPPAPPPFDDPRPRVRLQVLCDGKWIRPCSTNVPFVEEGQGLEVTVRQGAHKAKKSTRFFSISSFLAGAKNNFLGMVGFVRASRKGEVRGRYVHCSLEHLHRNRPFRDLASPRHRFAPTLTTVWTTSAISRRW